MLVQEIETAYGENHFVYGARKIWVALNKKDIRVARCTVERLMGDMGLAGARRGRAFKVTTTHDDQLLRPADLVDRDFTALGPNRLPFADLTQAQDPQWMDLCGLCHRYLLATNRWLASLDVAAK